MMKALSTVAILMLIAGVTQAAVIPIDADNDGDRSVIQSNGALSFNTITTVLPNDTTTKVAVFAFALPDLAGDVISTADIEILVTTSAGNFVNKGLDLYGVRASASNTLLLTDDFYEGAYDGDATAGVVALQEDYVFQASFNVNPETFNTSAAGASNLATWLQGLYTAGAVAGDFAMIRINAQGGHSFDNFTVAIGAYGTVSDRPTLTITTMSPVPEPSSLALMGVAGLFLGLGALRRRSK